MILVRPAEPRDLPRLLVILAQCPEAGRWAEADLRDGVLVAEIEGRVVGMLLARAAVPEEAEVLTVAVEPAARRQGAATALLRTFLDSRRGEVFLEVRDRKSTRLNSSHIQKSRMPSSA